MDEIIYIDADWNIVQDPSLAAMVKVVSDDGSIKFGIRRMSQDPLISAINKLTANTFEGHAGRPGERGGSLPRGAISGMVLEDDVTAFLQDKIDNAHRMNEKHPGIIESRWFDKLNRAMDTYRKYNETYGPDMPIVLIKDQPEVERRPWYGAVIAPSAKYPGEWQATYFDQDGFSGDITEKTRGAAYWEIFYQGINRPDPDLLESASDTDRFTAGVMFTMLPQEERDKTSIAEIMAGLKHNDRMVITNQLIGMGFPKKQKGPWRLYIDRLFRNAFEGHRGRPGEVGGSTARGVPVVEIEQATRDKLGKVAAYEPRITGILEGNAAKNGGEMAGLHNKMKSGESLARKIKSDMEELGLTADEAAGQINDALRYTVLYDGNTYTKSVKAMEAELKEEGFRILDHKRKNFYISNPMYEGYNTVWTNDSGETFELQFHTPQSLQIKKSVHGLYEQFRVSEDPAIRSRIAEEMEKAWKVPTYTKPLGFESLGTD